jgi:hypothetical protein
LLSALLVVPLLGRAKEADTSPAAPSGSLTVLVAVPWYTPRDTVVVYVGQRGPFALTRVANGRYSITLSASTIPYASALAWICLRDGPCATRMDSLDIRIPASGAQTLDTSVLEWAGYRPPIVPLVALALSLLFAAATGGLYAFDRWRHKAMLRSQSQR